MGRGGRCGAPLFGLTVSPSEQTIMATSSRNQSRAPLFGLVDVNNFYVSCERAFNPRLNACHSNRSGQAMQQQIPRDSQSYTSPPRQHGHQIEHVFQRA